MINIKNNDNKCFLWYHVRHLSLIKIHPERINKEDKKLANNLNYERTELPISKKDYFKIEKNIYIFVTSFVTKTELFIRFTYLPKNLVIGWICCYFLMKTSYIICILKNLTGLCLIKQRIKTKSTFVGVVCSVLVVKMF